ncbi:hypothetical protein MKW98_024993 [Papaver atlanticum]|uniref:glycerophosphodiester phosphodiesterase n=1 Tax=Papaver atlanticum TaxID=357466 RepID=A0AAD4XNX7_9MAGN|nr:hypothetical protein MKW98_024993 [Papaver atlanticum]
MARFSVVAFLLLLQLQSLLVVVVLAKKPAPIPAAAQKWLTLSGERPMVIARGGFSGLLPDSCDMGYEIAHMSSLPDMVVFCDVQISKDGLGFCLSDIRLDNSTNIANVFPKGHKTYNINGDDVSGWFAVDFLFDDLYNNVSLIQGILTRTSLFDNSFPLKLVDDATKIKLPNRLWLNVQYDMFYKQHNINVKSFIQDTLSAGAASLGYISSPEIGFLKSLNGAVTKDVKLVFRFLAEDAVEPTTKKTYKAILADLAAIKTFAAGILVPKTYIWPVTPDQYLEPHTSLVADAHKLGLEVYAAGFANDMPGSFNYSYDPTAEYLQFIDNNEFAVDGFLTDFPPTASEAIGCFALNNKTNPRIGKTLVISHNGASGVFPPCTDLAYQQAVDDGADIIDCSVQITKDGIAFCADSADLTGSTTAVGTFMSKSTSVPEIQQKNGIFSFDLTWSEIQSLKPLLVSPTGDQGLPRNPANKNAGKLILFSEFLELAKTKAVSGVMINIKNAAILANKGFDISEIVSSALGNATLDKQSTQQILIQSDDTSVLTKFKNVPTYKRVLTIVETISNVTQQSVDEIKKFADAVVVNRPSTVVLAAYFTKEFTDVVKEFQDANLTVYVTTLTNEFTSIAMDFFSDPILEISTYASPLAFGVDGLITDYPATANAYLRSPCADPDAKDLPYTISPPQPGELLSLAEQGALPPAESPAPSLEPADVVDPPLPPVSHVETTNPGASGPSSPGKNSQSANIASTGLCLLSLIYVFMVLY